MDGDASLEQPAGEQWETYSVSVAQHGTGSGSGTSSGSGSGSTSYTSAPTASNADVEWEGSYEGRCASNSYMNIGWSGMSSEGCLDRAVEVRGSGSSCNYVSYSGSDGPVGTGNFCRCYSSCDGAFLQRPAGEQWATHVVSKIGAKDEAAVNTKLVSLLAGAGVLIVLIFCIVVACCCCRKRNALKSQQNNSGNGKGESDGVPIVDAVIVDETKQDQKCKNPSSEQDANEEIV